MIKWVIVMLRRKAIRKIFITTFTMFTLIVLYLIPIKIKDDNLNINYDLEYVNKSYTNEVYLLGNNNFLVKTDLLMSGETTIDKIKEILNYLTIGNKKELPNGLRPIIPQSTSIEDVTLEGKNAVVNFSEELFTVNESLEERMIEAITYSITSLSDVDGVKLKVKNIPVSILPKTKKQLPETLTKNFGINKVYDIDKRNDINKVVVYYLNRVSNNNYYVPVTKYVNDSRDKIKIIIDSLSTNYLYDTNLMSFLNQNAKLVSYQEEDGIMVLNFNEHLFNNDNILEEVSYSISYSVFDNYNVDTVLLEVNGKEVEKITKNAIK